MVPDFVIVGEPKSGTTSLFEYLAGHPGTAASRRKEPGFWSPDVHRLTRVAAHDEYARLWDGAAPQALRFEASTGYLRSRVAVRAIREANPAARFVAMVRNPVDMAQSLHAQHVRTFLDDVADFERAWRLQDRRRRGEAVPAEVSSFRDTLDYAGLCAIGDRHERFFAEVPEQDRLTIVFDDLVSDPGGVVAGVLAFLGLDDDGRRELPRANPHRGLRSTRLAAIHRSMPRRLGPLYAPARAAARAVRFSPSAVVNRVNVVHDAAREPLRPEFRAELAEAFAPQVAKLSALLGRDLSHWR